MTDRPDPNTELFDEREFRAYLETRPHDRFLIGNACYCPIGSWLAFKHIGCSVQVNRTLILLRVWKIDNSSTLIKKKAPTWVSQFIGSFDAPDIEALSVLNSHQPSRPGSAALRMLDEIIARHAAVVKGEVS